MREIFYFPFSNFQAVHSYNPLIMCLPNGDAINHSSGFNCFVHILQFRVFYFISFLRRESARLANLHNIITSVISWLVRASAITSSIKKLLGEGTREGSTFFPTAHEDTTAPTFSNRQIDEQRQTISLPSVRFHCLHFLPIAFEFRFERIIH